MKVMISIFWQEELAESFEKNKVRSLLRNLKLRGMMQENRTKTRTRKRRRKKKRNKKSFTMSARNLDISNMNAQP